MSSELISNQENQQICMKPSGEEACIDYILNLLVDGVADPLGPTLARSHPRAFELLWELLHTLCVAGLTSDVTLKRLEVLESFPYSFSCGLFAKSACRSLAHSPGYHGKREDIDYQPKHWPVSLQARAFLVCNTCGTVRRQIVTDSCRVCSAVDGQNEVSVCVCVCAVGAPGVFRMCAGCDNRLFQGMRDVPH